MGRARTRSSLRVSGWRSCSGSRRQQDPPYAGEGRASTYPNGLAYAPTAKRVFVSDEHGNSDAVIDTTSNSLISNVPLGGGAGNTVYDPPSGHVLVAVHGLNGLVVIDPASARSSVATPSGNEQSGGIALNTGPRIRCGRGSRSLAMVDLDTMKNLSTYEIGEDPDVLAFDPGLKRLYALVSPAL